MIRINKKACSTGALLFLAVLLQTSLIIVNLIDISDKINYIMFVNNYVIGLLIIISLALKGGSKHFLAIAFFGCFLVFLMGQKPFEPDYNVYLTFTWVQLNTEQYFVFSCILFTGLAVTYYSYIYFAQKKAYQEKDKGFLTDTGIDYQAIKPFLSILLAVTIPCALYMQGKIVMVRSGMEYTSGYLVNVDIPGIIKAAYYIYSTVVLLYLALKPTKKQLVLILGTYIIIEGGLQLFQGRRALFASTILFSIWYLLKYHNVVRIKAKSFLAVCGVVVGLVVLFFIVEQSRDSKSISLSFQLVRKLLISTGGSDSVIANTIVRKNQFPASGIAYLFNPLVNNYFGNILTGKSSSAQGLFYLSQHHSFSHWISYLTEPSLYLSGHGMGSCYLAEVYLAFGFWGIPVVSILVGWFISTLNSIKFSDNIFRTGLVFYIVRRLFTLPRDGLLSWTSNLIYLIITYIIIYPFYFRFCRAYKGKG